LHIAGLLKQFVNFLVVQFVKVDQEEPQKLVEVDREELRKLVEVVVAAEGLLNIMIILKNS
jgi:hypothetical protein